MNRRTALIAAVAQCCVAATLLAQQATTAPAKEPSEFEQQAAKLPKLLKRLPYNNPGLVVDLGVGLWGAALPMDVNGDGKPELVVGWGSKPSPGEMLYERVGGADSFRFRRGKLMNDGGGNLQTSFDGGKWFVTSFATYYPDYVTTGKEKAVKLPFKPKFTFANNRQCLWRLYDMDGDGVQDALISAYDGTDYGWDDAFNASGMWTNGPQRGFFYWVKNTGTAAKLEFSGEAQQLMAGDVPMQVFGLPTPNFADIDGDGLRDLVSSDGMDFITWFKNVGTATAPKFASGEPIQNARRQAILYDLEMLSPATYDYDGDGDIDLVVAEEDGRVEVSLNTGKLADGQPVFADPVFLKEDAVELKSGVLNTPCGVDFDGDGDDDIVCGNSAGYFVFIENLDGAAQPKWAAPKYLDVDGKPIRVQGGANGSVQGPGEGKWGYTSVCVADWDGDGLLDLITNSIWGKVTWYRNVGTKKAATFAAAQPLEVAWGDCGPQNPVWNWWRPSGNELVTQWRTSVQAIDLTSDGLLDLVALDADGYLALYERAKVDGKLTLFPPKRVFHVEDAADNGFDGAGALVKIDNIAADADTQLKLDDKGRLGFHYRVPGKPGNVLRGVYRGDDERYFQADNATALRMNTGYAGRSGRRKFVLTDWDHDGKLDLLANSYNVTFFKNVSDDPKKFVFRDMGLVDGLRLAGHDTCPAVVGFDKDGINDLVVGAEDGFFYFLKNPRAATAAR